MPAFVPCPTCNAMPLKIGGGPVTHRHRPGCQTMRAERLACAECALPRPAGQALCDDCLPAARAAVDAPVAEREVPRDAILAALAEQAGLMRAVLRELQGLRGDLAGVSRLADAALSHRPAGPAPSPLAGLRPVTPASTSGGSRASKLELD